MNRAKSPSESQALPPRNADAEYKFRKTFARDRPVAIGSRFNTHLEANDVVDNGNNENLYDTGQPGQFDSMQKARVSGVLPEQFKTNSSGRLQERRENMMKRTSGRGWSCPIHFSYRPLGDLKDTEELKRESTTKQRSFNFNLAPESGEGKSPSERTKDNSGEDGSAAARLQEAQLEFSGIDGNASPHKGPPRTQLGRFSFPKWKPNYYNAATPRHIDEKLYRAIKASNGRVSQSRVNRDIVQKSKHKNAVLMLPDAAPKPVVGNVSSNEREPKNDKLRSTKKGVSGANADHDMEMKLLAAFDEESAASKLRELLGIPVAAEPEDAIKTKAETAAQEVFEAAKQAEAAEARLLDEDNATRGNYSTAFTPKRPGKAVLGRSVWKHGHEVMSPRVARLLRDKGVENLAQHAPDIGAPASVFLPYSSRNPHDLPLQMISFREYARTGGNILSHSDEVGASSKVSKNSVMSGLANSKDKAEKRLRQQSCKIIACPDTIPGLFLSEQQRKQAATRFNREIGVVKKHKRDAGSHHSTNSRRRPPTPGLPSDRSERPAERLHQLATSFTKSRASADESLLLQLDIIERERSETLRRKKQSLSVNSKSERSALGPGGAPRANWNWVSEIRKIRIMADCSRLEDMLNHAKRHVWYMGLVRDVNDLGVEAKAVQIYICDFIYRVISFGCNFDSNAFLLLLSSLDCEEFNLKAVQDMIHIIRLHTETPLEKLEEWAKALGLGVPEEVKRDKEHQMLHQQHLLEGEAAMQKVMADHQQHKHNE